MNYDLCLHVDAKDPAILRLALKNAANYYKALPNTAFALTLVANGPAVTLFTSDHADMRDQAAPLQEKGLRIFVCANAMSDNSLTAEQLWPGCEVVAAGLVEIVILQQAGFAYIKP